MKKRIILTFILLISFLLSGCTISFQGGSGTVDGGVFLSKDKGRTWSQKVLVPTVSGKPSSISTLDALSFSMDPNDSQALYFGSIENGLFYTYNGGDEWQIAKDLGRKTIYDVIVDFESKCIIYASVENKVFKSVDCNRTWSEIYYDNSVEARIKSIAIDHYNSKNIYIGTTRGEIIHSSDRGASWRTLNRFNEEVKKIIISPHDSRVMFVAVGKKGIYRTKDAGLNWEELNEKIGEKRNVSSRDISFSKSESGLMFLASDYGLKKSSDFGDSWEEIELITPKEKTIIYSFAVNPENSEEIYYSTNTTFYSSVDGGKNWTTKKLPTSRAGWEIIINPDDPNEIYLAVRKIKE
jgi:photosystem II stability/assembly factor-like uncharacterized protein